ncbi:MAG: TIGR00725 family protein [Gemmatimonadota bacterium]|jgi:hypothetical protein
MPAEPVRPLRIAVCGGGVADAALARNAEVVGERIARAGAVLICGGLGGVMEAAARGAAEVGGLSVGVLPGTDAAAANPWIGLALPTGLGEARNALVVRFADAVIALGGEWGTLSEIALAMRTGVPVVLLAPTLAAGLGLETATDPADAVDRALARATEARRSRRP